MPQLLAKFEPHNAQEFENEMRALIVSHMGLGQGNPTQWVVAAVCEAFQRGFGTGFAAAGANHGQSRATEFAERVDPERKQQRRIEQERKRLDYDGIIDVETKP